MYRNIVTDVFFDLDHTLWDFEKNSSLTFEKILGENNIGVDLDNFLEIYVPTNLAFWKLYREERITKSELRYQRLKTVFDELDYPVLDETINLLANEYITHLSSYNHILPHTIEILEYLRPNYKLHIITNGFQEIQEKKMRGSNIRLYFDQIINSEMAGVKKPNPQIFELALQRAKVGPEKSIMIGDNIEADILGAKAMGFHALHFNVHNDPLHDHCQIIHNLIEIKTFL